MTNNEVVTILLSAVALIVSFVTFYLTYFHKRAGLVGVLVGCRYGLVGLYENEVEYALSNTGNLQLVFREIELLVGRSTAGKQSEAYSVSQFESSDYPAIIEPSHIKLVKLRFKSNQIAEAKKTNERCIVTFTLISSNGKVHELMHDLTDLEEYNTVASSVVWKPFKLRTSSN